MALLSATRCLDGVTFYEFLLNDQKFPFYSIKVTLASYRFFYTTGNEKRSNSLRDVIYWWYLSSATYPMSGKNSWINFHKTGASEMKNLKNIKKNFHTIFFSPQQKLLIIKVKRVKIDVERPMVVRGNVMTSAIVQACSWTWRIYDSRCASRACSRRACAVR